MADEKEGTLVGAELIQIIDEERIYLFLKQTEFGYDLVAIRLPEGKVKNIATSFPTKNWETLEEERREVIIDDMIEKLKKLEEKKDEEGN